jgi:putative flippase GtrA
MNRISYPSLVRFARYAVVGVSTLAFDLLLLAALTQLLHVPYYFGTPFAFLVAVSINYAISRTFVFRGSDRPMHHSYAYFILIAAAGALFITGGVYLLVTYAHLYYLVARIAIAGVVGLFNYLTNLYWNFRVAGKHEHA